VFGIQGLEVAVVAFGLLGEIKLTGRATLSWERFYIRSSGESTCPKQSMIP
jgi:hypothetical protein